LKDFEYCRPTNLREAIRLLAEPGVRSRVMAGGTDLLVQLRSRRFDIDRVVDVKAIPELLELSHGPRRGLVVGAAVSCWRFYGDAEVAGRYPGLVDAAAIIGGIQVQGRASLGGNLCNSSPSADGVPPLIVHGALAEIVGPEGTRKIPVEDFCTGPGRNVLQPGELLRSLRVPPVRKSSGAHYLRFIPRNEMDIAVVGAAAHVELGNRGRSFRQVRLALSAVAPTPLILRAAGLALAGRAVDDNSMAEGAAAAQQAAQPISDMRAPAEYRAHLVQVLTERALRGAVARARGEFVPNAVEDATRAGSIEHISRLEAVG
jgi:CO/xanthine dehydrogenase FAD-binding subunit